MDKQLLTNKSFSIKEKPELRVCLECGYFYYPEDGPCPKCGAKKTIPKEWCYLK